MSSVSSDLASLLSQYRVMAFHNLDTGLDEGLVFVKVGEDDITGELVRWTGGEDDHSSEAVSGNAPSSPPGTTPSFPSSIQSSPAVTTPSSGQDSHSIQSLQSKGKLTTSSSHSTSTGIGNQNALKNKKNSTFGPTKTTNFSSNNNKVVYARGRPKKMNRLSRGRKFNQPSNRTTTSKSTKFICLETICCNPEEEQLSHEADSCVPPPHVLGVSSAEDYMAKKIMVATNLEKYTEAGKAGWLREVVTGDRKCSDLDRMRNKMRIAYVPPLSVRHIKTRLYSMNQLQAFLSTNCPDTTLTQENFCYSACVLGMDKPWEMVRPASIPLEEVMDKHSIPTIGMRRGRGKMAGRGDNRGCGRGRGRGRGRSKSVPPSVTRRSLDASLPPSAACTPASEEFAPVPPSSVSPPAAPSDARPHASPSDACPPSPSIICMHCGQQLTLSVPEAARHVRKCLSSRNARMRALLDCDVYSPLQHAKPVKYRQSMPDRNIFQVEKLGMPDITFFKSDKQSIPTKTEMSDKQGILAEILTNRETNMPTNTVFQQPEEVSQLQKQSTFDNSVIQPSESIIPQTDQQSLPEVSQSMPDKTVFLQESHFFQDQAAIALDSQGMPYVFPEDSPIFKDEAVNNPDSQIMQDENIFKQENQILQDQITTNPDIQGIPDETLFLQESNILEDQAAPNPDSQGMQYKTVSLQESHILHDQPATVPDSQGMLDETVFLQESYILRDQAATNPDIQGMSDTSLTLSNLPDCISVSRIRL